MNLRINIPKDVLYIMNQLESQGYEAYIVGGCVRDSIMNRVPNDWDITTNALPNQIEKLFDKTIPTGIEHGTVTVVINKEGYEVTTYRIDGEYRDNRKPNAVTFTKNIEDDLSRRDFTINSMAYNYKNRLVDPFGGIEDIKSKVIRTVGTAKHRFMEDYLRMLRAIRFSVQLKFEIEEQTQKSLDEMGGLISEISAERIQQELSKILLSDISYAYEFFESNMGKSILPEIELMRNTPQNHPYHCYDNVWEHTFNTLKNMDSDKLYLRLAALFHDIGKYKVITYDDEGITHFYKHELESVKITTQILKRLRYDNETINRVNLLIKNHDRQINVTKKSIKKLLNDIKDYDLLLDLIKLKLADILSQHPNYCKQRLCDLEKIKAMAEEIVENNEPYQIKDLNINGNDIIQLGYRGKDIGIILDKLLEMVIKDPTKNKKEYLLNCINKL